jgi:hypothetical protein
MKEEVLQTIDPSSSSAQHFAKRNATLIEEGIRR